MTSCCPKNLSVKNDMITFYLFQPRGLSLIFLLGTICFLDDL